MTKELIIFLLIFVIVFIFAVIVFNGRFFYAQLKYSALGPEPISEKILAEKKEQYPQRITVPNIGIDAPIIFPDSKNEYVLQKALEQGVIYWPDSSLSNEKDIKAPKNLNFKAEEEKSVLYLVSCWPINTDWKRIIIKAIKVDTE